MTQCLVKRIFTSPHPTNEVPVLALVSKTFGDLSTLRRTIRQNAVTIRVKSVMSFGL